MADSAIAKMEDPDPASFEEETEFLEGDDQPRIHRGDAATVDTHSNDGCGSCLETCFSRLCSSNPKFFRDAFLLLILTSLYITTRFIQFGTYSPSIANNYQDLINDIFLLFTGLLLMGIFRCCCSSSTTSSQPSSEILPSQRTTGGRIWLCFSLYGPIAVVLYARDWLTRLSLTYTTFRTHSYFLSFQLVGVYLF